MTIVDFVRLTRLNLWLIVLAVIIGGAVGYGYALTLPKVYTADASGYVVTASPQMSTGDVFAGSALAGSKADSYLPLVTSRAVASKVIEKLGLEASPGEIAGRVSASVEPNTVLLRVYAAGPTPEQARDVADATIQATAEEASRFEMGGEIVPGQQPLVRIIPVENALLPGGPSAPNMGKYRSAGAAAGLGLAYLFIFGRRLLDTRLRSAKDVEELANTTALGVIPQTPELRAKEGRGQGGRLGVAAEGFRQLRTNLRFVSVDNPPRSIVITSANPSEGKSTVAATLAAVLGEAGQKTIIVDADLRRPSLSAVFERDGSVGLSQVLSGQITVADALQDTDQANVQFIAAGRIPPNPSELLGSQRMKSLIEELSEEHLVLLDAPPLLPVTDAGLLSAVADGTLLVFAVGKTHKEQVAYSAKVLDQVGGRLLGAVLNLAPKRGVGSIAYGSGYGEYRYSSYAYHGQKDTYSGNRRSEKRGLFRRKRRHSRNGSRGARAA